MGQSQVPDKWRTDHLFILVGGNPLPNYVAGKLLLRKAGTLHLLHSPQTTEVAERIARCFDQHVRHQVQDPADDREVQGVLSGALHAIPSSASVGLNYTGGTKSMAVHAHATVRRVLGKERRQAVFTYLDARTLSLRRDDMGESHPAQFGATPAITRLLELHNIELEGGAPRRTEPHHEELNQALARAHTAQQGQDAYERWCQRYLRFLPNKRAKACCRALDDALGEDLAELAHVRRSDLHDRLLQALGGTMCCQGDLVKRRSQFAHVPIPFPTDPALEEVAEVMRETLGVSGDSFDPSGVASHEGVGFRHIKDLVKYLDGDWVEHLALAAFRRNMEQCGLNDVGMSLETKGPSYEFEFDVAAMQGYQLYAVSCTRSNVRWLCKSKLFEAYVRARQLGGDEARVGLVCCNRAPGVLEQQVTELWRAERGRIRVFGPQDLPHLPERFRDWLSG